MNATFGTMSAFLGRFYGATASFTSEKKVQRNGIRQEHVYTGHVQMQVLEWKASCSEGPQPAADKQVCTQYAEEHTFPN